VSNPVECLSDIEEDSVTVLFFFLELMQLCHDSLGELLNDGFENRIAN